MKFIKQDLLTLLIGLFLLASCKSTTTIGFEPEGDATVKGTLDNLVTVNSATLAEDPVSGVSLIRHPLGSITDPELGGTDASLAMSVSLPNLGYSFGKDPVLDSAVLVLPIGAQFYGDTVNTSYTFTVKQLANDLSQERSFLTSKEWPTESPVLGTLTGRIKPKTPVKITDIVKGAPDTLKSVVPQIRIKLSASTDGFNFIKNNIVDLDTNTLARNERFFAKFKGLQVTATKTGGGGIMFINFGGSDANIELYYKRKNATTTTNIDSVAVNFPIMTNTGPVTASIKHTYSTKVNNQISNSAGVFDVTYLQPLAGLRNKISFPDLKQFVTRAKGADVNSRIVINRAELVVFIANGTDVAPLTTASRLSLYRTDIAGIRGNIPDNDMQNQNNPGGEPFRYAGSEAAFGGFYDSINKRYIFTVTAYLQDLIDGKTEDYGTYLAPSSLTEFNIAPSLTSAARAIITTKNPATGDKAIKLNIYYTKVN